MTENLAKTLVLTTLDILQLKKLMIIKIVTVWICCIYLLIMRVDISKRVDVWNEIKDKINEVSSGECDYEKDYTKIKFNSDDDLPSHKPLKFHNMTIIIRSVFDEDGKLYPQVFLDDTLHELNV